MHVLISGAGIAGPTLAWFLARTGVHVTVLEKSQSILPHGQNVDIEGGAITALKKMRLLDEVKRFNTTEKGTQLIDPKGRPFAPFPVSNSSTSLTSQFEILRADMVGVLYRASKDHSNADYRFGMTIKRVLSNTADSVSVQLSNDTIQSYDLLVAADGQWSKVRQQCFPPESVQVLDKNMIAVYWTIPRLPSDNDWWNIYHALGSRIITLRPDPHGTIRAMFTCVPRNANDKKAWLDAAKGDRKTQKEFLQREFSEAGWQAQRLLDSVDQAPDFYFHVIQQIRMSEWSSNRVVCLGDAAYAPSPLTGQGTTLAITGAYILAGELSKLGAGEHPGKALEAYERVFKPHVEEVQKVPSIFPSIVHPVTAWQRWLLQTVVWALSKVVLLPWFSARVAPVSGEQNDDGFPLPTYSTLDALCEKESENQKEEEPLKH